MAEGLQWIILCEFGSLRSPIAAELASKGHGIATMFLIGGLYGLEENICTPFFTKMITNLTHTPNIAVILYPHEEMKHSNVLSKLNYKIFKTEGHFLELL